MFSIVKNHPHMCAHIHTHRILSNSQLTSFIIRTAAFGLTHHIHIHIDGVIFPKSSHPEAEHVQFSCLFLGVLFFNISSFLSLSIEQPRVFTRGIHFKLHHSQRKNSRENVTLIRNTHITFHIPHRFCSC